jgi:hypothetical protein
VSGRWTVTGTRILADWFIANADDSSPKEIDTISPGPGANQARQIIRYASSHVRIRHFARMTTCQFTSSAYTAKAMDHAQSG